MARAPNENVDKAYKLFKDGVKLVEIANQLNVAEGTVRSWKNRYKWDENSNATLQKNKRNVANKNKSKDKAIAKEVKSVLENADLTDKQRLFCLYYSKSFNATQSYLKAYGCSYEVALMAGPRLMGNDRIRAEIMHLKEIKRQSIMVSEDDIVEKYMRIAFADMTDFVEFSEIDVPVMVDGMPLIIDDKPLTTKDNVLAFKNSKEVDGSLICEISQGKNGSKVKLEDRQKALDWLAKYFNMNPMDRHRIDFDNKKLELEELKMKSEEVDKTINLVHQIPRPKKEVNE